MRVIRLAGGPIITPNMDPRMGSNINGPSLIKVPEWVDNALGRYYLYFGHHGGRYIRLAYADNIEGPWRTYEPGVLGAEELGVNGPAAVNGPVAAPDVHVDEERREIRMYYLTMASEGTVADGLTAKYPFIGASRSAVAVSRDGLHFTPTAGAFGAPYLRVFKWQGWHYALGMPGIFFRSRDGLTDFEQGPTLFTENMRHSAVKVVGHTLYVFYSNVGDCPERILVSRIDLRPPWWEWKESAPVTVLSPERDYEGVGMPLVPSRRGPASEPVRELRDPAVYEEDGCLYLAYAVAGEHGIALARVEGFAPEEGGSL